MRPAPPPASPTGGYALVVTAAVLWGLIGLFARTILDAGVGPLEIAFWRALIAGGAFALHARLARRLRLRSARDLALLTGFALIGVTLFYASLNLAIDEGGVSLAFVLLYTAPAFVAVLAWPLLGERLTRRKGVLVLLAVVGVVLVAQASGGGVRATPTAIAWGLAAGASYATYYLFGKWVLHRYAPVTIFAVVLPIGALGLLPFVAFATKTPATWGWLAVLGLVSTYLAYLAYYTGLRATEASRAVLVATVEPVVAAAIAALAFGERLGAVGWTGAALILVAAAAAALPDRARARTRVG